MIVNLRGGAGTGKSTIARALIEYFEAQPVFGDTPPNAAKIVGYEFRTDSDHTGYILGDYSEVACGGIDRRKWKQSYICDEVRRVSPHYTYILYEGLLTSNIYKRFRDLAIELSESHQPVFLYLDVSLEESIKRVEQRRRARGNTNPFKSEVHARHFHQTLRTALRFNEDGLTVRFYEGDEMLRQLIRRFCKGEEVWDG